jgi:hypothetical protein
LLWALGLAAERREPGTLTAGSLLEAGEDEVATMFAAGGETARDPAERARLWRDAAAYLAEHHDGSAGALIEASGGRLGGEGGLLGRLAPIEAFSDPIRKKSFLVAKIWERRGWLEVADPESWEVCADNVLMRLALRSGLVAEGELDEVREGTREAFKRVAEESGVPPPVLDDLLWERGRDDPDLLGSEAGDIREPPRKPGVHFY